MTKSSTTHEHTSFEVKSVCVDCGQELDRKAFARGDATGEEALELPAREETSLVNANIAIPVNLAAALNVLSDGSIAYAGAEQNTPIDQST